MSYMVLVFEPCQVVHLFFSPQTDDLARIQLAEAVFEAIIILNVFVPVFEFIQSCLKYLEYTLLWNDHLLKARGDDKELFPLGDLDNILPFYNALAL